VRVAHGGLARKLVGAASGVGAGPSLPEISAAGALLKVSRPAKAGAQWRYRSIMRGRHWIAACAAMTSKSEWTEGSSPGEGRGPVAISLNNAWSSLDCGLRRNDEQERMD
jgi:hypothetical protein